MKRLYVARTLNYWGSGETVEAAEENVRKAGGARSLRQTGVVVHLLPEGVEEFEVCEVSGALSWPLPEGQTRENFVKAELVKDTRKKD